MVVELLVAYRNNIFSSGHLMKEHMLFGTFDQKKRIAYCSENVHTHGDYTNLASCSFNGKEKDWESGFHYYGARYYWSEVLTGWLSVDPMMDMYPGMSPYHYCHWNPINLIDPDGRIDDEWKVNKCGEIVERIADGKPNGKVQYGKVKNKHYLI